VSEWERFSPREVLDEAFDEAIHENEQLGEAGEDEDEEEDDRISVQGEEHG
jgi:hypothetical protein